MSNLIKTVEDSFRKAHVIDVRSGDTVRVHQKIKEGNKERVQIFEGLVIRTKRSNSLTSSITVRRLASGVGVEKSFLLHSPLVEKVEVVKRSRVRRNNLSYMRQRSGKSARLASVSFDRESVNAVPEVEEVVEAPVLDEAPAEEDAAPVAEVSTDKEEKKEEKEENPADKAE